MGTNPKISHQTDRGRARFEALWRSVHLAGEEIGRMAALAPEYGDQQLAEFPNAIQTTGGARWTLAQEALADLDAMLRPGLAALQTIAARGQDTTAPALALWREFHALRGALLALATRDQLKEAVVAA